MPVQAHIHGHMRDSTDLTAMDGRNVKGLLTAILAM
jgi:hypothetical protein